MKSNEITCMFVFGFVDYDGSSGSAECLRTATVHVTGYDVEGPMAPDDDGSIDLFLCDTCKDSLVEGEIIDLKVEPITPRFRQGYAQGIDEARLKPMGFQTACYFVHEGVDTEGELPSGFDARTPLSGEWCDEAVDWDDAEVEQYRDGFTAGWVWGLCERASELYGQYVEDGIDR